MYTPKPFELNESEYLESFMAAYPFATLIAVVDEVPLVSHVPINRFKDGFLYGHFATNNPHASVPEGSQVTALFQGPHAYISPSYYKSEFNVPTWNYSAVHCTGTLRFVEDAEFVWSLFREMVERYEGKQGWCLPDEEKFKALQSAIRFFRMDDVQLKGKMKFSQNKSTEDIDGVIDALRIKGFDEVADFMKAVNHSKSNS